MNRVAAVAAAALLSACSATLGPGFGPQGQSNGLSAAPMTVTMGGRDVIVAPPPGRCLVSDHVGDDAAAVAVVGCDGSGPLCLVAVGAEPLFAAASAAPAAGFDGLAQWARSESGRRALGMGDGAEPARAVGVRRRDDALFVLFEDRDAMGPRRFWRAFAEVNRRLTMISVYDMAGEALGDDALFAAAEAQLAALRAAGGAPQSARPLADPSGAGPPPPRPRA